MRFVILTASLSLMLATLASSMGPTEVVNRYCKLRATYHDPHNELEKLVAWDVEPGWDSGAIIRSYEVVSLKLIDGKAFVSVHYDIIGYAEGDTWIPAAISNGGDEQHPRTEVVSYVLEMKEGAWVITEPILEPHIYLAPFVAHITMILKREGAANRPDLAIMIAQLKKAA